MIIRIYLLAILKLQVENEVRVEVKKTLIQENIKTLKYEEVELNINLSKTTQNCLDSEL